MRIISMLMLVLIVTSALAYILLLTYKANYVILDIVFIGFILNTYEWITGNAIRISLFEIQLGISDFLSIYFLILFFLKRRKNPHTYLSGFWAVVTMVFLVSMMRGFLTRPFHLVIEDVRRFLFAYVVPVTCFSSFRFTFDDNKTKRRVKRYTNIVVAFCFICWIMEGLFGVHIVSMQSDAQTTMRVLRPEQTLVLAMIAAADICLDMNKTSKSVGCRSIGLILTVVLLQHRTVWGALFAGILYIIVISKPDAGKKMELLKSPRFLAQVLGVIAVSLILVTFLWNTPLVQGLIVGLSGFRGGQGTTLAYREQLWTAHLATLSGMEWVIGKPFGSGYYINMAAYGRELTPHSAHIHTLIRCGLIGVVAMVVHTIALLLHSRKVRFGAGEAICVMLLVFFCGYTYNIFVSIILGVVTSTINNRMMENANVS